MIWLILQIAASVLLHELGHFVAARLLGAKVKGFVVNWLGVGMIRSRVTGWQEVVICLAGVFVNLGLMLMTTGPISRFNACMVVMNLVLPKSDGYNAYTALVRD